MVNRFFEVFLFEEAPAADRRADQLYLDEVDRCAVYANLLGDEYGREDAEGLSPSEPEFDRASAKAEIHLIFVKGADEQNDTPRCRRSSAKPATN